MYEDHESRRESHQPKRIIKTYSLSTTYALYRRPNRGN